MKMTNTQLPIEEIVQNYSTNQTGLNDAEVVRRQENGKNVLTEAKAQYFSAKVDIFRHRIHLFYCLQLFYQFI